MKTTHKKSTALLDKITYISGILLPILTIPQAYEIWTKKDAAGVSFATWFTYFIISVIFAAFGIVHKQRLLIITYVPFAIIEAVIVVGLILY